MAKLSLKPLQKKDLEQIMSWVNDPDVTKNFQHFTKKFTRDDEAAYIERMRKSKSERVFSIFLTDGTYIGQGGVHQISWENKLGRLSMFIKQEYQGRGYGQEALKALISKAFKELKLHKVWLIVWATNKKAIHIYKKLGFKPEGILRDEYFWRGRYHDMLRMSMLAKELRH